jgi:cytochrome-b5 reductase
LKLICVKLSDFTLRKLTMEESDHIIKEEEEEFPQEPSKPLDSECCGTGCTPCVFDIYEKQMTKWKLECDAIRKGQSIPQNPNSINPFLSPEKYQMVEIKDIIKETETIKIFRLLWPQVGGILSFPVEVGQHVLIRCDSISRQYTVLRVDEEQRIFDILIKIYKYEELESNPRKMVKD